EGRTRGEREEHHGCADARRRSGKFSAPLGAGRGCRRRRARAEGPGAGGLPRDRGLARRMSITLDGSGASEGIAEGEVFLLRWGVPTVPHETVPDDEVPREVERFHE